jgi:hypothetical protein
VASLRRVDVLARRVALALLLVTGWVALACCSSSTTDCTCLVDNNGERRTLACGDTSCVGGTSVACTDKDKIVTQGACAAPAPTGTSTTPDAAPPPPPDTSCSDLAAFCNASCTSPASVASDCQSVASAGDPQACSSWQASNGPLCK